jgi:hypothetical protein
MGAIIEGLNYSNRQIFQNVSQGDNLGKIKNIFETIYSLSLIFTSQNILLNILLRSCFNSSCHFSNGHLLAGAASAGGFPVSPLGLAGH